MESWIPGVGATHCYQATQTFSKNLDEVNRLNRSLQGKAIKLNDYVHQYIQQMSTFIVPIMTVSMLRYLILPIMADKEVESLKEITDGYLKLMYIQAIFIGCCVLCAAHQASRKIPFELLQVYKAHIDREHPR